jgi:hypothetical protein
VLGVLRVSFSGGGLLFCFMVLKNINQLFNASVVLNLRVGHLFLKAVAFRFGSGEKDASWPKICSELRSWPN